MKTEIEMILAELLENSGKNLLARGEVDRRSVAKIAQPLQMPFGAEWIAGKSFHHFIPITVRGKAGEVKKVEAWPSTDGRLLLFRPSAQYKVTVDTADGEGVTLFGVSIDGKDVSWWPTEARYLAVDMRSMLFDVLHPRQSVVLTFVFAKDCSLTLELHGVARDVTGDPRYAVAPPLTPCGKIIPEEIAGFHNTVAQLISNGGRRCDCWHPYDKHPAWPWREREFAIDVEGIDPGASEEIAIETGAVVLAHAIHVADSRLGWGGPFVTDGLSRVPAKVFEGSGKINYFGRGLFVPNGEGIYLRVGNWSDVRRPFKGSVKAQEFRPSA